jgi:hypothetical protein
MTETVQEALKCQCGLRFETTPGGARVCPNCDGVQPQEYVGFERRKTKYDIRFEMYWLRVFDSEYTDNTKKPKGQPEKGEPDESEGEKQDG